jgi:hypothetical protein
MEKRAVIGRAYRRHAIHLDKLGRDELVIDCKESELQAVGNTRLIEDVSQMMLHAAISRFV